MTSMANVNSAGNTSKGSQKQPGKKKLDSYQLLQLPNCFYSISGSIKILIQSPYQGHFWRQQQFDRSVYDTSQVS